jgi:hypothetical protein
VSKNLIDLQSPHGDQLTRQPPHNLFCYDVIASLTFAITSELVLGDSKLISWVLSEIPILTSVLPEALLTLFAVAMYERTLSLVNPWEKKCSSLH